MVNTGELANRPGGGSLVQPMGDPGAAVSPGKQTLVQAQAEGAHAPAGGGPRAAAGGGNAPEKKAKSHAGGGFAKYGGPSVREFLTQLVEQGKLRISGKQIALLDAVAQVETGGKIGCVQTYDDQIVSVGFKQVVLGHGSLEKIMKKAPEGFAKHGLSLDGAKKYTHPGWSNHPSQIAGVDDEEELRKPEWGMKFYEASMEPDVVAAMVELALGEAGKVESAVAKHGGGADLFSDPTAEGWLLETYNNRPAFMAVAIQKAVAGGAQSAADRDKFLDILAQAIVDAYVEQEPLLHYKKARAKKRLTPEQDAALLDEMRKKYEPIGRHKATNIVTKIKRNLVVPKVGAGGGGGDQAAAAPAAGHGAEAVAPPVSAPAQERLMSMPAPELELMSVAPEEQVCLPGDPVPVAATPSPAAAAVESGAAPAAPAPSSATPEAKEPDWVVRARAYNREHAALCEQFAQATGGACLGADGQLDPAEVARWQAAHGLDPDGRIGPRTLKAAVGKVADGAGAHAQGGGGAAPAGHTAAAPAPAASGGQGEHGGFLSTLADIGHSVADMGKSVIDWVSGLTSHGGGGGGGGGGGSGGGEHHDLPVPEHNDDVNAPEIAKKPATAPAKPVGKEVYAAGGILSKEHLGRYNLSEQEYQFKLRVYDAAVARLGDKIYGGVPKEDLVATEGGKQIRKDVAGPLSSMLAAMRADLKAGKPAGDKAVGAATGIAVTSAYRSPEHDRDLWDQYFQGYLAKTAADRAATGDPFGADAVKLIVKYIASRKAPPGGSNHSNGIAVDLSIEENGHRLGNSYDNQTAWKKSWQYAWLQANAATYGFKNYPKEAWHWDHKL